MNKKITPFLLLAFAVALSGCQFASEQKDANSNLGASQLEETAADARMIGHAPDACMENDVKDDVPDPRPIFQGSYFSIRYPAGFSVLGTKEDPNYGSFRSSDKKVIFTVYSPMWSGNPEKISVQPGETIVSEKEEEIELDCETELGLGTIQKIRRMAIRNESGGYGRSVIDIRLVASDGSGETRRAFSVRYDSEEDFEKYRKDFEGFMDSLSQLAD